MNYQLEDERLEGLFEMAEKRGVRSRTDALRMAILMWAGEDAGSGGKSGIEMREGIPYLGTRSG